MTAIAGVKYRGDVWLGADSAGLSGWSLTQRRDPKAFCVGDLGIAFTTSFRFGQILRYGVTYPDVPKRRVARWMATEFIDAVRAGLKSAGWLKKEHERETGGTALVATRGRLFKVSDDLQIGESSYPYSAGGCATDLLLGALDSLPRDMHPRYRLLRALKTAERFNGGVRGPFRIIKVPR